MLLAARADVSAGKPDGVTPLWVASEKGHVEIVKLLIANGANINLKANINGKSFTPLEIARKNSHTRIIDTLKENGAE